MKVLPNHAIILLEKSEKLEQVDGVVHLLLCSMALEAFLEDIKSFYAYVNSCRYPITINGKPHTIPVRGGIFINKQPPIVFINDEELHILALLESMEKESPSKKYEVLTNYLKYYNWKKGEDEEFKDLQRIIKLRNSLVHIKSGALELSNNGMIEEKLPRVVTELINKNIIRKEPIKDSWINILDQNSLIIWTRNTAIVNMKNILNILPDGKITNCFKNDYLETLKTFKKKS